MQVHPCSTIDISQRVKLLCSNPSLLGGSQVIPMVMSEIVSLRLRVNFLPLVVRMGMRMALVQVAVLRVGFRSSLHGSRGSHSSHVVSFVVGSGGDLQAEHALGRIHTVHCLRILFHIALSSRHF